MFNLDDSTNENNRERNKMQLFIPYHPYRIFAIGGSGFEYSNTIDDIYENIDDCNPNRKIKKLIGFDDMIPDFMTHKIFIAIIKELFIRCRKLNVSLLFIVHSHFSDPNISDQIQLITQQ